MKATMTTVTEQDIKDVQAELYEALANFEYYRAVDEGDIGAADYFAGRVAGLKIALHTLKIGY